MCQQSLKFCSCCLTGVDLCIPQSLMAFVPLNMRRNRTRPCARGSCVVQVLCKLFFFHETFPLRHDFVMKTKHKANDFKGQQLCTIGMRPVLEIVYCLLSGLFLTCDPDWCQQKKLYEASYLSHFSFSLFLLHVMQPLLKINSIMIDAWICVINKISFCFTKV